MRVVKPGYGIIDEPNITKKIEKIARVCYKSENLIGEGTDIAMISRLVKNKHYAMLEHGSLAYEVSAQVYKDMKFIIDYLSDYIDVTEEKILEIPRIKTTCSNAVEGGRYIVSGNLRAFLEFFEMADEQDVMSEYAKEIYNHVHEDSNGCIVVDFENKARASYGFDKNINEITRIVDFSSLSYSERLVHETMSVQFTCDRGVSHELVRHRDASFAQESQRYCAYDKDKFGGEVSFIKPLFFEEGSTAYKVWEEGCRNSERLYFTLLGIGQKPEEARTLLDNSCKTEIVVTASLNEWQHIFELRALDKTGPAHPQMKEVMVPLFEEIEKTMPEMFGSLREHEEEYEL